MIEWKHEFTTGIALAVAKPCSLESPGVPCMDLHSFAIKLCLMGQSLSYRRSDRSLLRLQRKSESEHDE